MTTNDLFSHVPQPISGLGKLAYNLWWSWHSSARELFRVLSLPVWRQSGHNPIWMLAQLSSDVLRDAAEDPEFLAHYNAVMDQFEAEIETGAGWFTAEHGKVPSPLAYFSAEYGLHVSLPVYAGGLGILAGDYLKECSDLAVPVVGVGLIYSQGYVRQRIRALGHRTLRDQFPG